MDENTDVPVSPAPPVVEGDNVVPVVQPSVVAPVQSGKCPTCGRDRVGDQAS